MRLINASPAKGATAWRYGLLVFDADLLARLGLVVLPAPARALLFSAAPASLPAIRSHPGGGLVSLGPSSFLEGDALRETHVHE